MTENNKTICEYYSIWKLHYLSWILPGTESLFNKKHLFWKFYWG